MNNLELFIEHFPYGYIPDKINYELARENKWQLIKDSKCSLCSRAPLQDRSDTKFFHFHHINKNKKLFSPSTVLGYCPKVIEYEIGKCILVCATCHGKIHNRPFLEKMLILKHLDKNYL